MNIEPRELRIGNRVMKGNSDRPLREYQIKAHDFKEFDLWIYEPIPLTEEWLVKFGFEEDGFIAEYFDVDTYKKNGFAFYYSPIGDSLASFGLAEIIFPKYVHQLQNLYFALTGEELTIKP
jgi:hypothetical protein